MFCEKCGKQVAENSKFCEFCGAPVEKIAEAAPVAETAPVQETAPVAPAAPQANYAQQNQAPQTPNTQVFNNFYQQPKKPVSVAGWLGRSLIPLIPCVGSIIYFIMLFVWAGDKSREESFNNWAKAQLWVMLISVVISIITVLIITAMFGSLGAFFSGGGMSYAYAY